MKKQIILIAITLLLSGTYLQAQKKPADTVVIKVGEASKITFVIQNKNDLETLKKYDVQAVVNDLIKKLEEKDTAYQKSSASDYLKKEPEVIVESNEEEYVSDWSDDDDHDEWDNNNSNNEWHKHKSNKKRTYHSFNIDLGMNNYITGNGFPDQDNSLYTVKPWGSWYVGLNGVQRTRLGQKFFLESSLGVSWYNFKFENYKTQITKDDNSVIFSENPLDANFTKSKLTATYLNAALVPMIDFGSNRRKPSLFDGGSSDSFRIGVGAYAGYRIDSYTKQVYKEDGDKTKPKDHDNFYLNNIRYGLRLQLGFDDIDLFFNYDLNDLYIENKGPKLNAFSFGITL
jgi:hypothetical protein